MFLTKHISPLLREWLIVIAVNLNAVVNGVVFAWSSSMLVKFSDRNSTVLHRPITDEEGTWIASSLQLPVIPSVLVGPILLNRLGRRKSIILAFIPKIVSCPLFVYAKEVWHLILARVLEGCSATLGCIAISSYVSEIADKNIRGTLCSLTQISMSLGVLIIMSVGPIVGYTSLHLGYTLLAILCFLPCLSLPESPYFLYTKGKVEDSIVILNTIRRSDEEIREELTMYEGMKTAQSSGCERWKRRSFLKPLGIGCFFGVISQFSGFNIVSMYFQTLMESTNTMKPELASMVFGLVQLCSSIVPSFITDRLGRKPVLCVTTLLIGVGMAGLGTFFWLTETGHPIGSILHYLPIVATVLINFGYSAGFGSLIFILIPELFNGPDRGFGITATWASFAAAAFCLLKCYSVLMTDLGASTTYLMFSACCVLACLFTIFCVPETNKRQFSDIQEQMKGRPVSQVTTGNINTTEM